MELKYNATNRQIRTTKRSTALSRVNPADERIYFVIKAIDTPWEKGTLRIIRCASGMDDIPATGSVVRLINRETGLYLGYYSVVTIDSDDAMFGHNIPMWDLCATSDHRPVRSGNVPQTGVQPATAPVPVTPAIVPATARRVSTRERLSAFAPKPQPEAQPPAAQQDKRVPVAAAGKRSK
jgi:hypothetical protein